MALLLLVKNFRGIPPVSQTKGTTKYAALGWITHRKMKDHHAGTSPVTIAPCNSIASIVARVAFILERHVKTTGPP
jgi:hypothetical protein